MRFWNCKNHSFAPFALIPWYVPVDETPFEMAAELANRLREKPNDTLCLVAVEYDIARAFIAAYTKRKYVWLWQARIGKGFRYPKLMFDLLKNWTQSRGLKKIRMRTPDREGAYQRRWGFRSLKEGQMEYIL